MKKAGIEYDEEEETKAFLMDTQDINTNIYRPAAPRLDASKDSLIFMQLDLDYHTTKPPSKMNMGEGETTVVRMFGVTNNQNSVMVHIYNFRPYFYARAPGEFDQ